MEAKTRAVQIHAKNMMDGWKPPIAGRKACSIFSLRISKETNSADPWISDLAFETVMEFIFVDLPCCWVCRRPAY